MTDTGPSHHPAPTLLQQPLDLTGHWFLLLLYLDPFLQAAHSDPLKT